MNKLMCRRYLKELMCQLAGVEDDGLPRWLSSKESPAVQETWVQSLGWEDHLEAGTATHSSALAWRIPWAEEPGGLQSIVLHRVGHD